MQFTQKRKTNHPTIRKYCIYENTEIKKRYIFLKIIYTREIYYTGFVKKIGGKNINVKTQAQ